MFGVFFVDFYYKDVHSLLQKVIYLVMCFAFLWDLHDSLLLIYLNMFLCVECAFYISLMNLCGFEFSLLLMYLED